MAHNLGTLPHNLLGLVTSHTKQKGGHPFHFEKHLPMLLSFLQKRSAFAEYLKVINGELAFMYTYYIFCKT